MRNGFKLLVLTVCFLTFLKFNTLAQCDQSTLVAVVWPRHGMALCPAGDHLVGIRVGIDNPPDTGEYG